VRVRVRVRAEMELRIEHLSSDIYGLIYAVPVLFFVIALTMEHAGCIGVQGNKHEQREERRFPIELAFYMFMAMLFVQRAICDHRYATCAQLPAPEWDCYIWDASNSFLSSCDSVPAQASLSCFSLRPPSLTVFIETLGIVFPAAQLLWLCLLRVVSMHDDRRFKIGLSAISVAVFFTSGITLGSYYDLVERVTPLGWLLGRAKPFSLYFRNPQLAGFLMVANWPDLVLLQVICIFLAIVPWGTSPLPTDPMNFARLVPVGGD
jgi:hypothetical protein